MHIMLVFRLRVKNRNTIWLYYIIDLAVDCFVFAEYYANHIYYMKCVNKLLFAVLLFICANNTCATTLPPISVVKNILCKYLHSNYYNILFVVYNLTLSYINNTSQ